MRKILLITFLAFHVAAASGQAGIDTFHIYFDLNVSAINKNMEKKIDLLIYNDKIINGSAIMVIGYADFLGSEGYNQNLSMERAKNIKNYLVKYGIDGQFVKLCVGKGKIERKDMTDKEGNAIDRKVDIVVNNNVKYEALIPPKGWKKGNGDGNSSSNSGKNGKNGSGTGKKGDLNGGSGKSPDIVDLTSLKQGQTILLKNVYFPPGSHIIKRESFETLEKLYKILNDNPKLRISIEGHVCCIHEDVPDALDIDTNEPILSLNRAKAIYNFLVKKGIDQDRLEYIGFGKQHPKVQFERNEEDANLNRRVEIRVLSN